MASKRTKGVTILYRKDPYNLNSVSGIRAVGPTVATFSDVAEQFTNNPNPVYDPSKAPGAVAEKSVAASRKAVNVPGKASRGHQKIVARTLFNQNQGKRLKRVT
jgi:hypothetical protein